MTSSLNRPLGIRPPSGERRDGKIDSRDTPDVVFHTVDAEGNAILAVSGLGDVLWAAGRLEEARQAFQEADTMAARALEVDLFEGQIELRKQGKLEEKVFAARGARGPSGPRREVVGEPERSSTSAICR